MEIFKLFHPDKSITNTDDVIKVFSEKSSNLSVEILLLQLKEKDSVIAEKNSKIEELQTRLTNLRQEKEIAETEVNRCKEKLTEMRDVLENFEKFFEEILEENQKNKMEKELALVHLANSELAFADVHAKYERSKSVLLGFRQNQDTLIACVKQNESSVSIVEDRYHKLRVHCDDQLKAANTEIERLKKIHLSETMKLRALIMKQELKINSLEQTLEQKTVENNKLSVICDGLIQSPDSNLR